MTILGVVACTAASEDTVDTDASKAGETTGSSEGHTDTHATSSVSDPSTTTASSTSSTTDMPPDTSSGSSTGDPVGENCGDGIEQLGESCDDGNDIDADGCNSDCVPSGEVSWTWTYSGGVGARDEGYAIVPGNAGEFYLAGYTVLAADAATGYTTGWLRRMTVQGDELWSFELAGSGGTNDVFRDLAFDGEFAYVAGYQSVLNQAADIWVTKFDLRNVASWTQTYNGTANGSDVGMGVALDPSGNVIMVGYSATATESNDILLRKYDDAGNVLWTRTHAGASHGSDVGRAVAAASDGSIYVAGTVTVTDELQNGFVARYDQDGNMVWSRLFNGAASLDDFFPSIALGPDQEPVVCGYEVLVDIPWRSIVRKYDQAGNVVWTDSFDGTSHEGSHCFGIATDHAGNFVMTGGEYVGTSRVIMVRKLDAEGSPWWARTVFHNGDQTGYGVDVGIDASNRIYIGGTVDTTDQRDVFAALLTP